MNDFINRNALIAEGAKRKITEVVPEYRELPSNAKDALVRLATTFKKMLLDAPPVDMVPMEAYNELREMFVEYVCFGIPNPAPYCENACDECLNAYGW